MLRWVAAWALACASLLSSAVLAAPKAYVWDFQDPWTKARGTTEVLREAGFDVEPLPQDRSPASLSGVVFIGSFASEDPAYGPYMQRFAGDLRRFVEAGNILVQMTQADQTEASPAFLSDAVKARREDPDFGRTYVLTDHPLLKDVARRGSALAWAENRMSWETFVAQSGFEVFLAADDGGFNPVGMEAAIGKGRVILLSMHFDKVIDEQGARTTNEGRDAFSKTLLGNLAAYTGQVAGGLARNPTPTPDMRKAIEFVPGSWTLALMPDTQNYATGYPGIFASQTAWIRNNRDARNIVYAIQLGDVTNVNTDLEWSRARDAFNLIEGQVPYAIAPGNHDYGPGGNAATRDTLLNKYFPVSAARTMPTFGGAMVEGQLDNTYHLFEAGGRKWIIVALEWGPRDETVAWADGVMQRHPDRVGILVTHAYMFNNDLRYDIKDTVNPQNWNPHKYRTPGGVNDGEELWQKLVRRHNFAFVFSGHVLGDGTGYRADRNDKGTTTHQILSNYQMRDLGGEGYLRLMEFLPDGKTVRVRSFSTLYGKHLFASDQLFDLELDQSAAATAAIDGSR